MRLGFSAGEAARLSQVPYDTLDYWARTGFLTPEIREAGGKGSDRVYSFRDLVALRVAGQLRKQGVSLQGLRRVVAFLRDWRGYDDPLAQAYLVTDGDEVWELDKGQPIALRHRPGQMALAWVVDVGDAAEELRQKIAA